MGKPFTIVDSRTGKILSRPIAQIRGLILQKVSSAASFNYLMNRPVGGLIIPCNSWSITPRAMMVIINHILIKGAKNIMESGSVIKKSIELYYGLQAIH